MAKNSDLPWDMVLGAEVVKHYKPKPEAYTVACQMLGLKPNECMMVAAHNNDLEAARLQGMRTAFVKRETEHGENQSSDLKSESDWDYISENFIDLADQLNCPKTI
jgi:2-haloacid dehalogenase